MAPVTSLSPGDEILKPADPAKPGYTFVGWYQDAGFGSAWDFNSDMVSKEITTLYAKWEANKYTLYFDANGGAVSPASKTITYGSPYGEIPVAVKAGYDFMGWFTSDTGGTERRNTDIYEIQGNETVYAQYKLKLNCVVIFESDGGTAVASKSVTFGQLLWCGLRSVHANTKSSGSLLGQSNPMLKRSRFFNL